ncbi:hypothetical protein [Thermococcus sp. MAR1]|uniref:hypothetical protein n=1 Tax=Thermococcus sp. MAR1 TaxID=1638263 RepID=UPI001438CC0D|nr:hypothetical protein [Thermococcus sp. MAR1]NJE09541.1 hypothetical protein [Thermococcus sp. MAR1]
MLKLKRIPFTSCFGFEFPINAFLKEFLFFDALRVSVKIELPLKSKITKAEFSKFTPACFDGIPLKLTNLKGTTNFDETFAW